MSEAEPLFHNEISRTKKARIAIGMSLLIISLERALAHFFYIVSATEFHYSEKVCNPEQAHNISSIHIKNKTDAWLESGSGHDSDRGIPKWKLKDINSIGYLLPILGGLFGDCVCGRYRAVLIGVVFEALSAICFTFLTQVKEACSVELHIISMVLMIFGVGFIRANIICLGAQYHRKARMSIATFFILYYFAFSMGEIIIYSIMLTTRQSWILLGVALCTLTLVIFYKKLLIGNDREQKREMLLPFFRNLVCCCFNNNNTSLGRPLTETLRRLPSGPDDVIEVTTSTVTDNVADANKILILLPLFASYILQALFVRTCGYYAYPKELSLILQDYNTKLEQSHKIYIYLILTGTMSVSMLLLLGIKRICINNSIRIRESAKYSFFPLFRSTIGFFLMVVSLIIAWGVKHHADASSKHRSFYSQSLNKVLGLMTPQLLLTGISEALSFSAGNQLAYRNAPAQLEAFTISLFQTVWGIGVFLQTYLVFLLHMIPNKKYPMIPKHVRGEHNQISLLFGFSALLTMVNLFLHLAVGCLVKGRQRREREVLIND